MGVTSEAKRAAVPASPVKIQGVIKRLRMVGTADMVEGGFHPNFDVFNLLGVVIDFRINWGKGRGKKRWILHVGLSSDHAGIAIKEKEVRREPSRLLHFPPYPVGSLKKRPGGFGKFFRWNQFDPA